MTIGHNNPPHLLALAAAQALLDQAKALTVDSAEASQQAAVWLSDATSGEKQADADRTEEKRPYLETCREVDAAWKPVTQTYADAKAIIKQKATAWTLAERERIQREQEAERKRLEAEQEAARLEAERALEAAMQAAQEDQDSLDTAIAMAQADKAQEQVMALETATRQVDRPVAVQLTGGARARGLKTVYGVNVTDARALVLALAGHPDVQAAALRVAEQRVKVEKSGLDLAGVTVTTRETL
jgi:hypothetical protein